MRKTAKNVVQIAPGIVLEKYRGKTEDQMIFPVRINTIESRMQYIKKIKISLFNKRSL